MIIERKRLSDKLYFDYDYRKFVVLVDDLKASVKNILSEIEEYINPEILKRIDETIKDEFGFDYNV